MSKDKGLFHKLGEGLGIIKPDPKEMVRKWQSELRAEIRKIEREIRKISLEQEKVKRQVRQYANQGDIDAAKILAREIVRSNQAVKRLYNSKAHLLDVQTGLQEQLAYVKVSGALQQSTRVMESMSQLVKASEITATVRELSKEMTRAGIVSEIIDESFARLDEPDIEEAADAEVDKVLTEIAGDVIAKVGAPNAKNLGSAAKQQEAEMDALAARLNAIKA